MMKQKIFLCLIILSVAGVAISIYLTAHFYDAESEGLMFCEGDACESVIQSAYSSIGGIPISSYAILFYIFVLLTLLIAVYAGGRYKVYAWAVIFPLSVVSLLVDVILAGILVKLGKFCPLCVATYVINILIFVSLLFSLKDIKEEFSVSFKEIFSSTLNIEAQAHDRRAVALLFGLFSLMLVLNVLISSANLRQSNERREDPVAAFYASEPLKMTFPESRMVIGNPKAAVEIVVFTDFFCKACYQFYLAEIYLLSKYKDKIRVVYYNYPRGGSCDPEKEDSRSCVAAKAFLAAAEQDVFIRYLSSHYRHYQDLYKAYDEAKAVELASKFTDPETFREKMNSPDIAKRLARDLKLVHQLNLRVTPTLFINGRKLSGVPPEEVFDAIMEKELHRH